MTVGSIRFDVVHTMTNGGYALKMGFVRLDTDHTDRGGCMLGAGWGEGGWEVAQELTMATQTVGNTLE